MRSWNNFFGYWFNVEWMQTIVGKEEEVGITKKIRRNIK